MRTIAEAPASHPVATVLAWIALAGLLAISFRPPTPVIWGDTPAFLDSALRTLEAGRLTVVGGRDPGYPALLAATFALGGSLGTVVCLQQGAWAALMVALAATVQLINGRPGALVPIILLALYPGLLMFRNVISAEIIYAVLLNLAVAALLMASCLGKTASCAVVAAAVVAAALAACCKSQGFLVPLAALLAGVFVARPDTPARIAVIALPCAVAVALLTTGSRFAAAASDEASAVFVAKTLFCNHLDIELGSDPARREMAVLAGPGADALMERLAVDRAAAPGRWPMLGFFGDACLFDVALDQMIANGSASEPADLARVAAAAYRRLFIIAVLDRPIAYAGKVARQMAFGTFDAWPPFGFDAVIPASTDDVPRVLGLLAHYGRAAEAPGPSPGQVRGALLSALPSVSTLLFRALSAAFVASLAWWVWTGLSSRRRRSPFFRKGGILIVMWAASIVTAAAAHTLDVSRYLVPATPIVALMLSLSATELVPKFVRLRRSDDTR